MTAGLGRVDGRDIRRERGVTEGVGLPQQVHWIGRWARQLYRRRADAAVADNHGGDALRQLRQHLWIADNAGIVMGVDVDEAGREHLSVSLRNLLGGVLRKLPDRADATGIDGDISCL